MKKIKDKNPLKEIATPSVDMTELEKAAALVILDLIKYKRRSVVSRSILKKSTGVVSLMSFDGGEATTEQTSPFETFTQVIEGSATFIVDGKLNLVKTGEGIIVPANTPNYIKPNGRFKMILTVIKSGYEF